MSFDLRIRFIGLSMFAPQFQAQEEGDAKAVRMHVLLPATDHPHDGGNGGGHPQPRHEHDHQPAGAGGNGAAPEAHAPAGPADGGGSAPAPRGGVVGHRMVTVDAHAGHPRVAGEEDYAATRGTAVDEGDAAEEIAAAGAGGGDEPAGEAEGEDQPPAGGEGQPHGNGEAHSKHERHFARIAYDVAYENAASTELSRTLKIVSLERRHLELLGLSGEELDPHIPRNELSDLGKLPPGVVSDMPGGAVAGRVTADSGALTDVGLGAFFAFKGRVQRMTTRMEWTVRGIQRDSLTLELGGLNGTAGETLPPLYPIGQTIHLMVFNAPAREFPPHGAEFHVSQPGLDADHFSHYYALYGREVGEIPRAPRPTDHEENQVGVQFSSPDAEVPGEGNQTGITMTCVGSGGSVGP